MTVRDITIVITAASAINIVTFFFGLVRGYKMGLNKALELMKEAHNPPEPEPEQSRIVRAH